MTLPIPTAADCAAIQNKLGLTDADGAFAGEEVFKDAAGMSIGTTTTASVYIYMPPNPSPNPFPTPSPTPTPTEPLLTVVALGVMVVVSGGTDVLRLK